MEIQKYQKGNVLNPYIQEWSNQWKERMQPSASSKVLQKWNASGRKPKPETSQERTNRRVKEETKRTWRSNAADIAHGIGEAALSFHPYTAIPYFGAKVGQDILNGNVGWQTAVNASIPLFHLSPQAVGLKEATNVALEDAANTGSKTARNWRVTREINQATKSKPDISNRTISVKRSNNEITEQPDLVYTLYNEFGEPIGQTNIGGAIFGSGNKTHRMVDGVMSMHNAHKVSEDTYNVAVQDIIDNGGKGLESGWSLMMPQKTLAVTSKFPHTVIGQEFGNPVRLLTGTSKRPIPQRVQGNHYLEQKPSFEIKYNESTGSFEQIPISNSEPYVSTSLKFFERKPSRISQAEREGISKGDRNQPFKRKQLTEHIQGNEAVKMFKEYGGEPIPEGSINGGQLRKYVAEARERYGLVNNANITDEEIAQALYKHSKELGGNTAAVNAQGEPQLLFRGDTNRYTQIKERMSPEELAKKSGTMDNSLGNLFLGEFPDSYRGVDRYIGTWRNFNGNPRLIGSGTGSKVVWDGKIASEIEGYPYLGPQAGGGYKLYSQPHRYGNIDVYKLPASMIESGVNDLNAFIVRTPQMRNASSEISVLNDDWMLQGAKDSHFMSKNYKYNPKTYSMENIKTGESLGEVTTESAPESRVAMGDHYKELLKEAKQKQQGLLKSEANSSLRDEHSQYSYFALPNFNIQGAKHLLPYDLRIPRNWKDKNIYRGLIPLIKGYTLYNQPKQQLQYQKQGGKMNNVIQKFKEYYKKGGSIYIKPSRRGSFRRWCGGKVTNECIQKGKNSSNPAIRKKAIFAQNVRRFKH